MQAEQVRRWLEDKRAGEARGRTSDVALPEPPAAWRQASALIAMLRSFAGWPVPPDEVRLREDAAAADAWMRLRAAYRRRA